MARSYKAGAARGNSLGRDKGFKGSSYGPAGPAVSLITGRVFDPEQGRLAGASDKAARRMPCTNCGQLGADILITAGANPDGTLKVHMLCSQACAAQAGFPWAGRN